MKKFSIFITVILSAFVFVIANNRPINESQVKTEQTQEEVIIYTSISIDGSEITLPYTITVPAPPLGTILNIGGPCNENMTNWNVQNGNLSITYDTPLDIMCLQDPDIYYIETPTLYDGIVKKYKIKVVAY